MENGMTTEEVENLRNNLRALDNESLIDIFTDTRSFLDANLMNDVLLTQVRVIREEMLQRMSEGADKKNELLTKDNDDHSSSKTQEEKKRPKNPKRSKRNKRETVKQFT